MTETTILDLDKTCWDTYWQFEVKLRVLFSNDWNIYNFHSQPPSPGPTIGSPVIDGIFFVMHAVQFNERSACHASMFTSCIYIFLRLASKYLNCTRSPDEMVQKLHKYDWKHKINTSKIDSDNFTKLPATFLGENNNENQVKFATFFNILLNFSLWLCVVQVVWHNFKRFSSLTDDDKISLAFEIFPALHTNEILSSSAKRENRLK